MLIVRRRQGQSILIGDDIAIEIMELGPAKVKIGVHAPANVCVQRQEIAAVRGRNLEAARMGPEARLAIANRFSLEENPKTPVGAADKPFEARYSGHPEQQENPGPAGRRDVSLTGR